MLEINIKRVTTFCLFCLAFIIRLFLISKGSYYVDALELVMKAEQTLDTLTLQYMHAPGHPLVVIIASLLIFMMRLLGVHDSVFSVNFMSVLFGSLGVAVFYLFSRKVLDEFGALMSSLILCFLPLHIFISTIGLNHSVSMFFNLTGIYFMFLYLENYRFNRLILSSLFLGLGAAARLVDSLILIPLIFLYLAWSFKNSGLSKKLILRRLAVLLIVYSGTALFFYLPMFFTGAFSQLKAYAASLYYFYYDPSMLLSSLEKMAIILTLPGVLFLISGAGYYCIEKNKILFYFLLSWLIGLFICYGSLSISISRYLLLPLIPAIVMQGHFASKFRRKIIIYCLIFLLVLISFFQFYPIIYFRHKNNLQADFAKFVKENTEPTAYVIAMDEGFFIEYYAHRRVLYKATGPQKKKFDEFFIEVDRILEDGNPVYIISSSIYGYDPKNYFFDALSCGYNLQLIGRSMNQHWHKYNLYSNNLFMESLFKIKKKNI